MSETDSGSSSTMHQTKAAETRVPFSDQHSVQITTIRLNGENFMRWSQSARMYIRGRGKIGYLTGEKKEPKPDESSYATWDAENSMVMTWLVNSMAEDISVNYMCYHTAQELWDNVNQMYSDLGNQSQVYELTLKLGQIRQGEDNVTKYFNSLKNLWQDLDLFSSYEWKSSEDGKHYKKMVEDNRIFTFLIGLNAKFDEVRGRIIGRQPLPSMGEVFSEVRREESRRLVMLGKKVSTGAINMETSALVTCEANASQKRNEKPSVYYDVCEKPYHTRETCWKIHGKPANWKSKQKGRFNRNPTAHEELVHPFNKEQVDYLLKLLKSNSTSSGSPNTSLAQTGDFFKAYTCRSNSLDFPWITDSGASDHMTNSPHFFQTYSPCSGSKKVRIAYGSYSAIAGKGLVQLSNAITLKSVLHVPKLNCNLLSEQSSGKMIGSAKLIDGLYYFDNDFSNNKAAQGLINIDAPIAIRKGTRTCTQHPIAKYLSYEKLCPNHKAFTSNISHLFVPRNIQEALDDQNWKSAVLEEMNALEKNKTWDIVDLPKGKRTVGCRWLFNIKCKANGSVERYKACIVAKGFTQTYGIDYQETFAPVAKIHSIRVLLSLAVNLNWQLHQLDIKNAFLNGDLEEEVFMSLPPGFQGKYDQNKVCRLRKSLYGLKQSPRVWFERFLKAVKAQGYYQSQADHTMFYKHSKKGQIAVLIVYVDDIILTGDDFEELARLK
ncbi:uncharacterized protein [Henckelia pumila]|uniref:uncharacterized protein n=1 Tax=Henckelia pumila TaxID=405737 RepID=UPI003C6E7051